MNFIKKEKINAFNNFPFDPYNLNTHIVFLKQIYFHQSVEEYILSNTKCSLERIKKSFQMLNLIDDILKEDICNLSFSEKIKIELAISLILNEDQIIFYQFDKYFMKKDLLYFKNLLKKLVYKYKKTIILIEVSMNFMLDFVDYLVVLKNEKEILEFKKDDFFDLEIKDLLEVPKIIDFQQYINRDKKILNNYTDLKELIKAIFREVQ